MAKKTPSEKETRAKLLGHARAVGAEAEFMKLMARYDELLKHAKSDDERKMIATLGVADVNKFFGGANTEQDYFLIDKKTAGRTS